MVESRDDGMDCENFKAKCRSTTLKLPPPPGFSYFPASNWRHFSSSTAEVLGGQGKSNCHKFKHKFGSCLCCHSLDAATGLTLIKNTRPDEPISSEYMYIPMYPSVYQGGNKKWLFKKLH